MSRSPHTQARRHITAALRHEVRIQLANACYGKPWREPVQSPRTVDGVHVTTQSR